MKQKLKTIMNLALATKSTEVGNIIGLIVYSRKFFPIFSGII